LFKKTMFRGLAVIVSSLPLLTAAAGGSSSPNFVVFFADDLGYGDVGHPTILTPNLDRLGREGLRFTNWYSAFHVCSPSRASLLTGRLPVRVGVSGRYTGGVFTSTAVGGLPRREVTWSALLPHETMCVGKWHLGQREEHLPTKFFDRYYGIPYSVDMGRSAWHNEPASQHVVPLPLLDGETIVEQPVDLNTLSERYVEKATTFVRGSDLFALYFAFQHVHVPNFASKRFCGSSKRGRFGDALAELDWSLGEVMEAYAGRDVLTFFTSDNGPWLAQGPSGGTAGPFFEGKGTTWEGGVRVPAIAHWPGKLKIPPGGVSQHLVATYDIFATILAVAKVPLPTDRVIDGRDLSPILLGGGGGSQSDEVRDCIFIYKGGPNLGCPDGKTECPGLWAARCGSYKAHFALSWSSYSTQPSHAILNATTTEPLLLLSDDQGQPSRGGPLVFDVDADPSEKFALAPTSDEYRAALATIEAAIAAHRASLLGPDTAVVDEILRGSDDAFALCCSRETNCTCNPENFDVPVCSPVYPDPTDGAWQSGEWPHDQEPPIPALRRRDTFLEASSTT